MVSTIKGTGVATADEVATVEAIRSQIQALSQQLAEATASVKLAAQARTIDAERAKAVEEATVEAAAASCRAEQAAELKKQQAAKAADDTRVHLRNPPPATAAAATATAPAAPPAAAELGHGQTPQQPIAKQPDDDEAMDFSYGWGEKRKMEAMVPGGTIDDLSYEQVMGKRRFGNTARKLAIQSHPASGPSVAAPAAPLSSAPTAIAALAQDITDDPFSVRESWADATAAADQEA